MLGIKFRSLWGWGSFSHSSAINSLVCVATLFVASGNLQAADIIIDGEGFEPPAYSLGTLEGQAAKLPNDAPFPGFQAWDASIGTTSTAVVQSTVVNSGTQAVKFDRAANEAPGGGRFGVPVTAWPDNARYICIEWDMWVDDAMGPNGSFGPFFGAEAYDDAGVGSTKGRMGSLGVDATTGDVLYTAAGTGFYTETTSTVSFGAWNHFRIDLDFQLHEYSTFLNGSPLLMGGVGDYSEPFEEGSMLDDFSDAPIAGLAAAGDPDSQGLVGTAYFDNYKVFQVDVKVPEPGSLMLVMAALVAMPMSRRRR
ncbi:hypothetical protein [Bythopirellula polymerisocia]|uniref:PEP-CTERM protein-sorting domain-containing protein n=1 Tax=Bythopirellula polymerisocia TaxID=2528003 RepID=A0A5C6CQP8_9BACT|nr:hypothetical protein [Bythopirellula polymerisocia]TWU25781.1 hypothetical protein Pla144_29930 [Bythopirellula polymerisocia]